MPRSVWKGPYCSPELMQLKPIVEEAVAEPRGLMGKPGQSSGPRPKAMGLPTSTAAKGLKASDSRALQEEAQVQAMKGPQPSAPLGSLPLVSGSGSSWAHTGIISVISRASTILPIFVGKRVQIYNGKIFIGPILITTEHVGHKFGEFAFTKKPAEFKKKKS